MPLGTKYEQNVLDNSTDDDMSKCASNEEGSDAFSEQDSIFLSTEHIQITRLKETSNSSVGEDSASDVDVKCAANIQSENRQENSTEGSSMPSDSESEDSVFDDDHGDDKADSLQAISVQSMIKIRKSEHIYEDLDLVLRSSVQDQEVDHETCRPCTDPFASETCVTIDEHITNVNTVSRDLSSVTSECEAAKNAPSLKQGYVVCVGTERVSTETRIVKPDVSEEAQYESVTEYCDPTNAQQESSEYFSVPVNEPVSIAGEPPLDETSRKWKKKRRGFGAYVKQVKNKLMRKQSYDVAKQQNTIMNAADVTPTSDRAALNQGSKLILYATDPPEFAEPDVIHPSDEYGLSSRPSQSMQQPEEDDPLDRKGTDSCDMTEKLDAADSNSMNRYYTPKPLTAQGQNESMIVEASHQQSSMQHSPGGTLDEEPVYAKVIKVKKVNGTTAAMGAKRKNIAGDGTLEQTVEKGSNQFKDGNADKTILPLVQMERIQCKRS